MGGSKVESIILRKAPVQAAEGRAADLMSEIESLGKVWEELLSEEEIPVRRAWSRLSPQDQASVLAHLRAMAEREGWQPAQQKAARAALRFLPPGPRP